MVTIDFQLKEVSENFCAIRQKQLFNRDKIQQSKNNPVHFQY